MGKLLICVGLALLLHVQLGSSYILSCYFTNWGQYRPGAGKYLATSVDPCLCDIILYAFAGMKDNEITTIEYDDVKFFGELAAMKKYNPNMKTVVSIGGWNFGTQKFHTMVSSSGTRQTFITSVIKFLREYGLDGLDIDWEYPATANKELFTVLVQELRAAFEAEGKQTNRPRLLVTAAMSAGMAIIESSYEVVKVGEALDYLNVMTYDYHGGWSSKTGENSPLYSGPSDIGWAVHFNINFTMNYWRSVGAPGEKLLVGFATYGHTWKLASSDTGMGAPTAGAGPSGPYTRGSGFLAYYEICDFIKQGATVVWNSHQKVPYAFNKGTWVGYDNVQSFKTKAEWLMKNNFGGAMVWTLDMDDFSGTFCGEGKYPLISTLKSVMGTGPSNCHAPPPPPPAKPDSKPHYKPGGKPANGGIGFCKGKNDGLYPDPTDKGRFYECSLGMPYLMNCQSGLVFDSSCACCNWA